jgi:flagellar hook-associated protein 2
MSTISSPGIASGLNVQEIVAKLTELDRAPLVGLQKQASTYSSKLSVYGSIKSMMSALGDAANKLSRPGGWNDVTATSSNAAAIGVTASAGAATTSVSMQVQRLAAAQSTASTAVARDSAIGSGQLSIQLGSWAGGGFAPGDAAAVSVTVEEGETLSQVAAKINAAGAGVSATVLRDDSGERLLLRSRETGEVNGFRIQVTDGDGDSQDGQGLSMLAYDPGTASSGTTLSQAGVNAQATINGINVTSASNRMTDALPGFTLQLNQVTTEAVNITVSSDEAAIKKNVQAFVDAYNAINNLLNTTTRYDATSKSAGSLQGDRTAVGLQTALRGMMRSMTESSPYTRLSDIGIEFKDAGKLEINTAKLDKALLENPSGLQALFTTTSDNPATQGFGHKIKAFADGLTATGSTLDTRTDTLQEAIRRNGKEQDRVNDRATRAQARYLEQYNAMDAAVGKFSALNAFVSQQITLWNNMGNSR